jgi:regulator of protease activity HflC (stomatin/prohibitin superfamily)
MDARNGRGRRTIFGRPFHLALIIAFLLFGGVAACTGTRIKSGEVGVRVVDIGARAGVQDRELSTGWYFWQPGSYVLKFPTTARTETWSTAENDQGAPIVFNNADGVQTAASVSIQVRMDPQRASNAVQRYRLGFEDMVNGPVRRRVQGAFNAVGTHFTSDHLVTGQGAQLLAEVYQAVRAPLEREGVIIDNIVLAGPLDLPPNIIAQINNRVQAEREAATQAARVQVVQAQAQQRIAEAEGRARAIAIEGAALNANPQVLRLREIERWNGQCPLDTDTCVIGAGALVTTDGR